MWQYGIYGMWIGSWNFCPHPVHIITASRVEEEGGERGDYCEVYNSLCALALYARRSRTRFPSSLNSAIPFIYLSMSMAYKLEFILSCKGCEYYFQLTSVHRLSSLPISQGSPRSVRKIVATAPPLCLLRSPRSSP